MSYLEEPSLPSTLELDHDAFSFSNLEECFPSDDKGMADGCIDGTGQLNFGFAADAIANTDHFLSLSLGPHYNGSLGFPIDGQGISVGHPIDIPNFGGQHRSGRFPLTPPDSDGPDSPDADQVLLCGLPGTHNVVLSSSHSGGLCLQQGIPFNNSGEFQSQLPLSSVSEPRRKRKRDSECSESLTANSMSSLRLNSLKSEPDDFCVDSSGSDCLDSPDPFAIPTTPDPENSYQCLKWSSFKTDECCSMFDDASQELPPPQFRVDADKGFNYSFADEAFVCQKKNHLQITAFMNLQSSQSPKYVQVEKNELRRIDKFCLHLYGIKMESQASQISVEQSQADRSKRHYEPIQFDVTTKEQAKITVGRLHFSETTANNMRKKGKPNPDQRYFLLVVAVYAHTKNDKYLVCANVSERIIVRASNPGQFENDMDAVWSRGQTSDSVFRMGRVGINTDKPEEALSVYGNLKVTGRLVSPSDKRIKEGIEEVDTSEQLRNVSKINLYKYRYSREYMEHVGLDTGDCDGKDTGVLAQEVKEVLPEAVKESDDLVLHDGKTIERFLVVNKERIFMENVGAVKELCKLTENLEVRIDELETVNQKLQRRRCDTVSTFSSLSLSRCSSFRASINSNKQTQERRKKCHHHHHCHYHHHHCACRPHGVVYEEPGWCSPKFMQFLIVTLVFFMVVSIAGMATIYVLQDRDDENSGNNSQRLMGVTGRGDVEAGKNASNSPSLATTQPVVSIVSNLTNTVKPHQKKVFSSISAHTVLPTDQRGSQRTDIRQLRLKTTLEADGNRSSPTFQSTPRLSKPSEPTPVSERKTTPPKSGQCCNLKNFEYPSKLLQGKEVYDDKPSMPGSLPGTKLHDPELRILENNYVITYSNKSSHNSSHYIPFSADLPFQPITLEINSTASSLVLLCSHVFKHDCPEKKTRPRYDTAQQQDSWKMCHRWQLPVAYYYQSTYHFRLVLSPTIGNVTCHTLSQPTGPRLQDFYFHFIRKCNT